MSIIGSNILAGASGQADGGYEIARSLRFNSGDSAHLTRTPSSNSNSTTFTWSAWIKVDGSTGTQMLFSATSSGSLQYDFVLTSNQLDVYGIETVFVYDKKLSRVFRDPSAWYHLVVAFDTTDSTPEDRIKIYVNGERETDFATNTNPSASRTTGFNKTVEHSIGGRTGYSTGSYFNGYQTEINFIDGSQLGPENFGETDTDTGAWVPKKYSGTYGTNGFYLKFADNSGVTATTLGKDNSGNGNNWTPNNFSVTAGTGNDSLEDTPTNNWCTMNALAKGTDATLSNGNLDVAYGSASTRTATIATMGMSSGKWYWEHKVTSSTTNQIFGITNVSDDSQVSNYPGYSSNGWGIYGFDGDTYHNSSTANYGSSFGLNDIIGCAFDADNGKIWWSKNGTFFNSGDPAAGTNAAFSSLASDTYYPAVGDGGATGTYTASMNFGQRAFDYTPPTGFKALNAKNTPVPTIKNGTEYFNTVLYTGAGGTQSVTGVGFQPDFAWFKRRDGSAEHGLHDAVRGVRFSLSSDGTGAQLDRPTYVTSFDTDGFSFGDNVSNYNSSGSTYVAWNWKAGGAAITPTQGTISSTASVNADAGFSIVSYTANNTSGATVGHGLGVTPSFAIFKNRDSAYNWTIYHKSLDTASGKVILFTSAAQTTSNAQFNSTAPNSTVFTLGGGGNTNSANGDDIIAYCFAEVEGYSKFGSYTGNGSADGTFVYLGFKPAFLLIKSMTSVAHWAMLDNKRNPSNVVNDQLFANLANSEYANYTFGDFTSNGFKIRDNSSGLQANYNTSGATYIFLAFAETPFKYANAV